jgi:iron complex transport system permease protein
MKGLTLKHWIGVNALLAAGLAAVALVAVLQGTEHIGVREAAEIFARMDGMDRTRTAILLQVRLPRILLAGMVGGLLALCGAAYQTLLRNPLADPFILGVSSGAALGVYAAMLLGLPATFLGFGAVPFAAFAGGIGSVWLVYQIARVGNRIPITGLLLSGVVVNAVLSALILFITSLLDSGRVMNVLSWIMGHIGSADAGTIGVLAVYSLAGGGALILLAKPLNLLAMGEEEAMSLGLGVEKTKKAVLLLSTFLTGLAVSVSGIIGFVGLIAPHAVRMVLGSDHRLLLPASALAGAAFLIAADTAARTLLGPVEIPVGVLTALCGGPFFLILLRVRKNYWT